MNKLFNTQAIFMYFLGRLKRLWCIKWLRWSITPVTWVFAKMNLLINRPKKCTTPEELGRTWQQLMPWDDPQKYELEKIEGDTAIMKINIVCPLKGINDDEVACGRFMHYDRTLMKQVGGSLTVVKSQSNLKQSYCVLHIKKNKSSS